MCGPVQIIDGPVAARGPEVADHWSQTSLSWVRRLEEPLMLALDTRPPQISDQLSGSEGERVFMSYLLLEESC